MNKNTEIFGIDISKDVFDVYSHQKGHQSFKNATSVSMSIIPTITIIRLASPHASKGTLAGEFYKN